MSQVNLKDGISRSEAEILSEMSRAEFIEQFENLSATEKNQAQDDLQNHIENFETLRDRITTALSDARDAQAGQALDFIFRLEEMIENLETLSGQLETDSDFDREVGSRSIATQNGDAIFDSYELSENGANYEINCEQNPFEAHPQRVALMLKPGHHATIVAQSESEIILLIEDENGNEATVKINLNGTSFDMLDLYIHGNLDQSQLSEELKKIIHEGASQQTIYEKENNITPESQASRSNQQSSQTQRATEETVNTEPTKEKAPDVKVNTAFHEAWKTVGSHKQNKKQKYQEGFKEAYQTLYTSEDPYEAWDKVVSDLKARGFSDGEIAVITRMLYMTFREDLPEMIDPVSEFIESLIMKDNDINEKDKAVLLLLNDDFWDEGLGVNGNWRDRQENVDALGILFTLDGISDSLSSDIQNALAVERGIINNDPNVIHEGEHHLSSEAKRHFQTLSSEYSQEFQDAVQNLLVTLENKDNLSLDELKSAIIDTFARQNSKPQNDLATLMIYVLKNYQPDLFDALMSDVSFGDAIWRYADKHNDSIPIYMEAAAEIMQRNYSRTFPNPYDPYPFNNSNYRNVPR